MKLPADALVEWRCPAPCNRLYGYVRLIDGHLHYTTYDETDVYVPTDLSIGLFVGDGRHGAWIGEELILPPGPGKPRRKVIIPTDQRVPWRRHPPRPGRST